MENRNIIIILVAIIVVLAAVLGVMFLQTANAKEPTKIKITNNKTLYEGDGLSVKLTDSNNTAISNQTVKITIVDKKGKAVVNETVKTNSKGKAKLDLNLTKGKYNVTVAYGGNVSFKTCNATEKLTIKKVATETVSEESYSSTSGGSDSGGWTTTSPGGDTGSSIVVYHDGNGHKYVTRYFADGSSQEDGIAYDENYPITS